MRRYVSYDAKTDTTVPAGLVPDKSTTSGESQQGDQSSSVLGQGKDAISDGLPKAQTWTAGTVTADLHLSGDDPRMFPGVLTRGHRTNSLRNMTQFDEVPNHGPQRGNNGQDAK
jgi:hypothetical protein